MLCSSKEQGFMETLKSTITYTYICGVEDDATNVWKKCIKKSVAQNTADHVSYRILLCCTYCMCTPHGNLTR